MEIDINSCDSYNFGIFSSRLYFLLITFKQILIFYFLFFVFSGNLQFNSEQFGSVSRCKLDTATYLFPLPNFLYQCVSSHTGRNLFSLFVKIDSHPSSAFLLLATLFLVVVP